MKLTHLALIALTAAALAQPSLAREKLTQLESSVQHSLADYGFRDVDVTALNRSQVAQIKHLASSGTGTGRIRGQIAAILRRSHVWELQRKR